MPEPDFDLMLDGAAHLEQPAATDSRIPKHTALHAGRESVTTTASPLRELLELRQNGHRIDWSTVR